ncbi:MAG: hypothetical protein OXS35_09650, partial [Dehalococcoidia bacterium]|nr:hypothetical protein [Dehalococcoidia bacterium]
MLINLRTALFAAILAAALAAEPAYAHGFGARYDLPVPLSYFLAGAAAAVVLSFAVVGVFVRGVGSGTGYPTYDLSSRPWFRHGVGTPAFVWVAKAASVFMFGLVIATSLAGSHKPLDNLSPTFIWVIWWVGAGFVAAVIGNVWIVINPWKIVFELAERLFGGGRGFTPLQRYPRAWSVWPAVVLFGVFAWIENVYSGAAVPGDLGTIIVIFSVVQWVGMYYFGKNDWLRYGDPFSVLFGLFARFSLTEVRVSGRKICRRCSFECTEGECVDCYPCFDRANPGDRTVVLRPFAAGLVRPEYISVANMAFVILALATVTFDGLKETSSWNWVHRQLAGIEGTVVDTIGLYGVPLAFLGLYLAFSWAMRRMSGADIDVLKVARVFVLSFVPIALAYHFAHFLALLLIQGHAII